VHPDHVDDAALRHFAVTRIRGGRLKGQAALHLAAKPLERSFVYGLTSEPMLINLA
jgi:hypothetical protein